ncbi:hypothetical protein ABQF35_29655 [Mycobacterium syngnathidarum]
MPATSLRDIATLLALSPGAVYPRYKTKESLLYAISVEGYAAALAVLADADEPDREPTRHLEKVVAAYAQSHADNHALGRVDASPTARRC